MKQLALFVLALVLSACGGGSRRQSRNRSQRNPARHASGDDLQINLGDDPADRLVATSVTVNSVALLRPDGSSVVVMSTPRPMEMMRLMGTVAPLAWPACHRVPIPARR